jgi:hypothetical protein
VINAISKWLESAADDDWFEKACVENINTQIKLLERRI